MVKSDFVAAGADALQHAEQTSIVRSRRLPLPPSHLGRAGFTAGQALIGRSDASALVLAAQGEGRSIQLSPAGLVGTAESFGFQVGQVVQSEVVPNGLRVSAVDGLSHDSYTNPMLDVWGIAIPPSWLIQAFTNNPNVTGYLRSGGLTADMLAQLAIDGGCDIAKLQNILDFGCGVGRVLRFVRAKTGANLVGYDLHVPSIDWCNTHMGFARWEYGKQKPPIAEADGSFDLIYAISVLTHLDEEHQDLWLAEWKRLLRPGGLLIATYRSEHFAEQFLRPKSERHTDRIVNALRDGGGFTYLADDGWAGIFPEYYSDAYHATAYVEQHWAQFFEVVRLYPAGSLSPAVRQDVALLRVA